MVPDQLQRVGAWAWLDGRLLKHSTFYAFHDQYLCSHIHSLIYQLSILSGGKLTLCKIKSIYGFIIHGSFLESTSVSACQGLAFRTRISREWLSYFAWYWQLMALIQPQETHTWLTLKGQKTPVGDPLPSPSTPASLIRPLSLIWFPWLGRSHDSGHPDGKSIHLNRPESGNILWSDSLLSFCEATLNPACFITWTTHHCHCFASWLILSSDLFMMQPGFLVVGKVNMIISICILAFLVSSSLLFIPSSPLSSNPKNSQIWAAHSLNGIKDRRETIPVYALPTLCPEITGSQNSAL